MGLFEDDPQKKALKMFQKGKFEKSLKSFDKVLRSNPDDYGALGDKGHALSYLGRDEEAVECYDRVLAASPDDVDISCMKGSALKRLNRHKDALECYDKAVSLDLEEPAILYDKGMLLAEAERHEEALAYLDRSFQLNPDNYDVVFSNACAHEKAGKYDRALELYFGAVKIKPSARKPPNNKGIHYKILDHYFEMEVEHSPSAYKPLNNAGLLLARSGKYEDALKCYDEAIRAYHDGTTRHLPAIYATYHNKGKLLEMLGWSKEALTCYEQALEEQPDHVPSEHAKERLQNTMASTPEITISAEKHAEPDKADALALYNESVHVEPTWGFWNSRSTLEDYQGDTEIAILEAVAKGQAYLLPPE